MDLVPLSFYDEVNTIFVDPMFVVNLQQRVSMGVHLNLKDLISTYHSLYYPHTLLALISRARNKQVFLGTLKQEMLAARLPLMHANRLFVRINGVYKQASIERQAVKRKDLAKERP
jgi:hypothetical protein